MSKFMTKNYPYVYSNLKKSLATIKMELDKITKPEFEKEVSSLKQQLSNITLSETIEILPTYNTLKLIRNILDHETPSLSKFIQNLPIDKKFNQDLNSLITTEELINRYQVDLSLFIRSMSLRSPEILTPDEINRPDILGKTLLMYATSNSDTEVIKTLLQKGANPFQ